MEIVTQRRRRPRDSPPLDKVNKNVPTRTSRGTCEAITARARANIFYCIPTSVTSSTSTSLLCPARRVTAAFINAESPISARASVVLRIEVEAIRNFTSPFRRDKIFRKFYLA